MIKHLGDFRNKYQNKMLMHQLIKMTLGETDPSINDALDTFGGELNFENEEEDPPLIKQETKEVKKPEPPKFYNLEEES